MSSITDAAFTYKQEIGTIVTTVAAAIVALKKFFTTKKKTTNNSCTDCGLCRHKLFQIMDSFLANIDNPKWMCINDYKTAIAKDMIRDKFHVGKHRIKEWVCANKGAAHSSLLSDSFNDMIVTMIDEYETKWKARGINPIIIEKLSMYHNNNAKYAVKIGKNELSRGYNETSNSLHHLLDGLIIPYTMFIQDIRNVMDSFNGQLADDVYNGIPNDGRYIQFSISRLEFSFEE